jgi:predicted DNA-binding transcriptional regulator AlpA
MTLPITQRWLTSDMVADFLGVSRRTVTEKLAKHPKFPKAVRFTPNGQPRWDGAEIVDWAENLRGLYDGRRSA